jgi:hypothetical protein
MEAFYIDRGTNICIDNIIGIKEANDFGTVSENFYRIKLIVRLGKSFYVETESITGRYSKLSLSKLELEEMVDSGMIILYNQS